MRSKALHILSILLLNVVMATTVQAQSIDPSTIKPKSKIKILGNVYGGGDQAAVQGNTTVEINKGQYAGDIFGGGNGALNNDGTVKASADIGAHNADGSLKEGTGATRVTINGGEILYDDVVALDGEGHVQKDAEGNTVYTYKNPSNHNVYGGGNQACNVAGDTHIEMKKGMISLFTFFSNRNAATDLWQQWYDQAMNPNTQKKPIASVFGAGYGAHTDVAGNTNVNINISGTTAIHPANGTAFTHAELEDIDKIIQRWQPDPRVAEQFVTAVHGGGYDGTVGAYDKDTYVANPTTGGINYDKTSYLSQTNVSITGQPFIFHVYGGGLGSKAGADANGNVNSHVGAVYGAAKVDIQGGIINGDVFGGGAGIAGQATIPNPFPGAIGGPTVNLPYTYAAQVMRETDVTVSGNSTVIFGNVYGGGDIANTGWYVDGARPALAGHVLQQNHSLGVLDYTTSLKLNGGNILGKVFGGGNGRKKSEVEQYKFVGAVIGSTNVSVNGSKIWNTIYGGGNTGCVYSCEGIAATQGKTARTMATATFDGKDFTVIDGSTNVAIFDGFVAQDIFGGGYGDDPIGDPEQASSADIYGNTFVYFERGQLEYSKYWKPREIATKDHMGSSTTPEVTGQFLAQRSGYDAETDTDYRNTESDITHNLYGGGNMACTVMGNTHVYMSGAPTAPAGFNTTDYYNECIANVAKPHFSVFGGGFGPLAKVTHNAFSDINLAMGTGLHSIIGGGMNGPVGEACLVHVGNDPMSLVHHVYGGGYYAPCEATELQITRGTILENVFGGSVMGNITPYKRDNEGKLILDGEGNPQPDTDLYATTTIIGLQTPGDGRHSSADLDDENGVILRSYTYAQHQNKITIGGNVYGANDVSGTVNGVAQLTIYGGTIKGDVFGAGNGDHIGYYVPNELRYDMGAHFNNYFTVMHDRAGAGGLSGKTYVGRPQTIGGVELTLEGNTPEERVKVLGQVFGGGNSCTIGDWSQDVLASHGSNPHLTRDDPAYFLGGGKIDMNLGSHITIGRTHAQLEEAADGANYLIDVGGKPENVSGLYMGCSGRHLATQDWSKTDNYYHHYYDASTNQYWPGFAVYQDNSDTPLTRQEGLQSFLAYMNNILVWSDNVNLNIKNQDDTDADDIWISNFVGGGFRGSMKAKTENGQFHYTLPRGVTIGHDVIGGAFNTDVVYRIFDTTDGHTYKEEGGHYVYRTDDSGLTQYDATTNPEGDYHHIERDKDGNITSIVRFYYDGGMLSELAYGTDKASNTRIDRILKKYSTKIGQNVAQDVRKDFAGGSQGTEEAFTFYKQDALVYLELDNRMQVEYVDGHVHGGNVFGGCFSSGRVEGDIWTDYRCYQESQQANSEDFNLSDRSFDNAKDFENNFAMMLFGAGYGANTNIQGSAYVRVLHPEANPSAPIPGMAYGYPRLYNVFGGSYEGKVEGNTNIYFNPGKYGYVTGAIYGGGCNGYVGGKTFLELAGGYIDEAYGGARNANVGGGTHIWAYDGQMRWWGEDVIHSNGAAMIEADAEKAPLFIGKLYGGTDISGQICTDEKGIYSKEKGYQPYYSASYWPKELYTNKVDNSDGMTYIDTYLQVGGTEQSDNGFPIIGSVYAAGNGEKTEAFFGSEYDYNKLPHQHSAMIEVSDGNIVYAFGGGNRATVTDNNYILVRPDLAGKHTIEDLGVQMYDVMKKRILSVAVDCYDEKLVDGKPALDLKNASIQRLFGGNNIATMAIQPKWQLISGRVNNVYSGGNMGDMTYYNPAGQASRTQKDGKWVSGIEPYHATNNPTGNLDGSNSNYTPRGLSITIEHPEIHIGSLYGGCRLSDVIPGGYDTDGVTPLKTTEFAESEDYYGATVNITDGYIENVYGGNDISGMVHFGTNVNISGAVSGNVYGSGNGFYLYKWDKDATQITEHLLKEFDSEADEKRLCYTVPASAAHGGAGADNTQKLLTINDARPSVEKAFLNIAGLEHYPMGDASNPKRVAYVKGNVFCGGNASTILGDQSGSESFTKFKIGSYVTLNGVFMGSDGYAFTQDKEIKTFADLNGFTDMEEATVASSFPDYDGATATSLDHSHNPILLNVYMMAVDMKAQPKDFNLNLPLTEAHIGTYCGGGNRGSMLVDKMVDLPFHHDIIIYDKIVGACLDANIRYNQGDKTVVSRGGYSRAVDVANNDGHGNTKMRLNIASQFVPLVMDVPADKLPGTKNEHGQTFAQAIAHDFLYDNRTVGVKYDYEEFNDLFQATWPDQKTFEDEAPEEIQWKVADGIYAPSCNIYGGCYQSGEVEGDIELNLYSNMLRYVNENDLKKSIAKNIACFNVYGAGFGQDSHVWGNVRITMDRNLDTSTMGTIGSSTLSSEIAGLLGTSTNWTIQNQAYSTTPTALDCSYPSFNNVIGGGRNGKLIGNSTIKILNGLVYTDVAGGCYASDMYGSTQVIVGYPKYYQCNTSGTYNLDRADKWNTAKLDGYGLPVIKQSVSYLKGDLVPNNIYESIIEKTPDNERFFTEVTSSIDPTVVPSTANGARGWDDVFIKIGNGVYGGGYSLPSSTAASAGNITTNKLKDDAAAPKDDDLHAHNFDGRPYYDETTSSYKVYGEKETVGYGGNSSVMVADMDATDTDNSSYNANRDHIHISTLTATVANIPSTSTVIGKFIKENDGRYTHQGDHNPVNGVTYYTLTGDGGIYGDGHLTFCEGFRSADVTRYGWAEGTPKHPILMNTFQRMDLLSVNDCCLMLQGAQDFATDQIDATIYSITRINEMRLNSTLNTNDTFGQISAVSGAGEGEKFDSKKQRNYLAFFNNVHYLGSIVTNDTFGSKFHAKEGNANDVTYLQKKQEFINDYMDSFDGTGNTSPEATNKFKQRNVATARNAIGINNGYCLRVLNQEYDFTGDVKVSKNYYGPIVGVCEVKLLTLVQGEGGGYVYADNVHEDDTGHNGKTKDDYFLMTSGNFVFPGIIEQGNDAHGQPIGDQYIVDDCFVQHFGTPGNITTRSDDSKPDLDEAHYWYVEGNKYFFQTTLTGFTYKKDLVFDLIKTDPNIVLSGLEKGSSLNIKKIEWLSAETGFHRKDYEAVLPNSEKAPEKTNDYEFDIEIGGYDTDDWKHDMPRYSVGADDDPSHHYTQGMTLQNNHLPQFNIKLQDKLDNSGDLAYVNHLDEPELVKIYLQGKNGGQIYEYTITVNIVYLQGPTVTGGVKINNCALPGENIAFSTDGLVIKTPELMPVTSASWQILPLKQINEDGSMEWDMTNGIVIDPSRYREDPETQNIIGDIRALYKQNEYNIAYIFTAGGYDFPVMPVQTIPYTGVADYNATNNTTLDQDAYNALTEAEKVKSIPDKDERMIVVHNYHRMKDVTPRDLQIEAMPIVPDYTTDPASHHSLAEAKIYIEDEDDLTAFVNYLNMATEGNVKNIPVGLTGLDIIMQKDITLTKQLPTISQPFAGTFHGDGYHIDITNVDHQTTLFGSNLTGKVYNLGLIGGTICNDNDNVNDDGRVNSTHVINSYEYATSDDFKYGKNAYLLSHAFYPTTDTNTYADYVANRYANGDYQYATTDRVWSLRTGAPNWNNVDTHHDENHTHDAARWKDTDGDDKADTNVPLYDGTMVINDEIHYDGVNPITYRGLPEGYANDYLFFGQHLDKENADAYPVHIEPVAKGDANPSTGSGTEKGGNRVFETAGYYQSKLDQQFYYNKDAWALYPELTAIDYTSMTAEGDRANTLPTAFSVDSNKDYDYVEDNDDDNVNYNNATTGHVTQNLLVYNRGESVFSYKDINDSKEYSVQYHNIADTGSGFSTDYFHLVDKQDFNAPIAFNVNTRAWYERKPQAYRNVTAGYQSGSAWEGIVLPFTATKVTAEKNGEISHFYGSIPTGSTNDRTLHHEYWLQGYKGVTTNSGTTVATFARPAIDGVDNFTDSHQAGTSYTYPANTYFTSLFNYNNHVDTRKDEYDDNMSEHDDAWYAKSHTFSDYVPLTAAIPYIVAFPGNDFYEFSMESYYKTGEYGNTPYSQKATFEASNVPIGVSDNNVVSTTADGYTHHGTYLHQTGKYGINDEGTEFVSDQTIVPFRTYIQVPSPSPAPGTRAIFIADSADEGIIEHESEMPAEELIGKGQIKIRIVGTTLIVESNIDTVLPVYSIQGKLICNVHVKPGTTKQPLHQRSVYIIGGKKYAVW